jgi:hypothetical protein
MNSAACEKFWAKSNQKSSHIMDRFSSSSNSLDDAGMLRILFLTKKP